MGGLCTENTSNRNEPAKWKQAAADYYKLQQLENFLKQLYADRVAGILETEDFKQMYREKKEEKDQLERQLTDCEKAEKQWTPQELVHCFWKNAETEKGFWSLLIEHIEVTPEQNIQIDFRFSRPHFCS